MGLSQVRLAFAIEGPFFISIGPLVAFSGSVHKIMHKGNFKTCALGMGLWIQ